MGFRVIEYLEGESLAVRQTAGRTAKVSFRDILRLVFHNDRMQEEKKKSNREVLRLNNACPRLPSTQAAWHGEEQSN